MIQIGSLVWIVEPGLDLKNPWMGPADNKLSVVKTSYPAIGLTSEDESFWPTNGITIPDFVGDGGIRPFAYVIEKIDLESPAFLINTCAERFCDRTVGSLNTMKTECLACPAGTFSHNAYSLTANLKLQIGDLDIICDVVGGVSHPILFRLTA